MLERWGIIADDLTGANDTGVQFARYGYRTTVFLDNLSHNNYSDVLVLNTDSRQINQKAAYQKVEWATKELLCAGVEKIYKKIDSAMRGNIGTELDAVCQASGCKTAFICPAFPSLGRTIVNGMVCVHGQPIHESPVTSDKITPVADADSKKIINAQSQTEVICVSSAMYRDGIFDECLKEYLEKRCYIVFDAETDDDMRFLAEKFVNLPGKYILCGSGGLARALSDSFGNSSSPPINYLAKACEKILVVCGTPNPIAREQTFYLQEKKWPVRQFSYDELIRETYREDSVVNDLLSGGISVIAIKDTCFVGNVYDASLIIRENLADFVNKVCHAVLPDVLIINGGDTSLSICRKFGAWGLDLMGEIDVGMPYGLMQNDWGQNLAIVTKSGSFGNKYSLHRAVLSLSGDRQYGPSEKIAAHGQEVNYSSAAKNRL